MTRIALAGFIHETNTFSPLPTTFEDFNVQGGPYANFMKGAEILQFRGKRINNSTAGFIDTAEGFGYEMVPLVWTAAEPANQVTAHAFESIMGMIAAGLADQGPFDGVYLDLHGAMVFEGYNDGETEILRRVRAIVGDIPIVGSLDLHGNITPRSIELASALVGYRTYPHVDLYETGERCARLLQHLLTGKPLFPAFRQIPFLMPISSQSTNTEPCRSIYAEIERVESDPEVVSATIMAGFPPADIEDTGPSVFTYATTPEAAGRAADSLADTILSREAEFTVALLDPDQAVAEAIHLAENADKPVILADVQDNSGGGATSDTPWILEALVRHKAPKAALGLMYDPGAAEIAHKAGEGAEVTLGLGGKLMPGQAPFEGIFKVKKIYEGEFMQTGPMGRGIPADLGKMAHLQMDDVHVVVASRRTQCNDQAYFRVVGIEPTEMKIVVVKSTNHYRADFEPISSAIIPVVAPAAIVEDPSKVQYQNLRDGVRLKGLGPVHRKPAAV